MDLEKIIEKINHNQLSSKDALAWRGKENSSLWHVLATHQTSDLFTKLSKTISKKQLIEKFSEQNDLGDTPAHLAAWASNFDVLKEIVRNTSHLDFLDSQNRNICMVAIKNKNRDITNYCLENTKNLNQQDKHLQTVLHYAQHFCDFSTYQHMIQSGCDESIVNKLNKKASAPQIQEEDSILDFVSANKKKAI